MTIDDIISLTKRRGFIFPSSDIYGGIANTWDYGPLGVELKNNIKQFWWKTFVHRKDDMYGMDAAIFMNKRVWEASGHTENFIDMLVECKKCHSRFREDHLMEGKYGKVKKVDDKVVCPLCGGELSAPRKFNGMFKTFMGSVEDEGHQVFLRPETAQGMFVNFKNIVDSLHPELPFGLAQIGKAFRNEITPGDFIFRTREFEQMEIEYFIPEPKNEDEWQKYFEHWIGEIKFWLKSIGISEDQVHLKEIAPTDRAHYSKRTTDLEYKFPFGQAELYGLAYRTNFDLATHQKHSGVDLSYTDKKTGKKFLPHVIEPSFGVDRTVLAVLCSAYQEEKTEKGTRVFLKLPFALAPYKVAVFPLLANKLELVGKATSVYHTLKENFTTAFDDIGNIGKRYRRQDEIGTPYCVTIDFDTLKDDTVTLRDRDTMTQKRLKISELVNEIK